MPTVRKQGAEIIRLKEAGIRPTEIAARLGIGRASVYRVLGDHTSENARAMVVTPTVQCQPPQFIRRTTIQPTVALMR